MPAPLFIPPHINCQNCGDCCGMIPAFPEEVDHIKLYLKQHPEIIEKARLQSHRSFNCPFRDNNEKKCMVYSVRPIVCRLMGVCNGMECKHGNKWEKAPDWSSFTVCEHLGSAIAAAGNAKRKCKHWQWRGHKEN